jgi:hypothetical protein
LPSSSQPARNFLDGAAHTKERLASCNPVPRQGMDYLVVFVLLGILLSKCSLEIGIG